MDLFVLAGTATEAAAAEGGGLNQNLIQLLFLGLLVAGAGLAAVFYASSALANPWKRALSNTDRQALVNAVIITGIALLIGIYTVAEPIRREAAAERQLEDSVHRGTAAFAQYCVACHGIAGTGGPVPKDLSKGQPAAAPPLANRSDFRPASEIEMAQRAEFIRKTISRGRPNTPMPAWGLRDGGSLNDEEISELATFIMFGNWSEVQALVAPGAPTPEMPEGPSGSGDVLARSVFVSKGCVACHTIQEIPSARGNIGPNLSNLGREAPTMKPGMSAQDYIRESILTPGAFLVPGYQNLMPSFQGQVTPEQLDALVDYLSKLGT
jgi:mono/diheme cytochrome c family protein